MPTSAKPAATKPTAAVSTATAALTASSPAMHLAEDALPHRDQDPALRPHLARRDQLDGPQHRSNLNPNPNLTLTLAIP